jgi:type III pantothenate kinase
MDKISLRDVTAMSIASVVPPLIGQYRKLARTLINKEPLILCAQTPIGLQIAIENSTEIGADRLADAVAAVHLFGAPVIIVDFGTATNIEVISANGVFVGGIIAPGLQTSAEALFAAAARLSKIDIGIPSKVIGASTREAVQSGLTYGEIDRIDGLITRILAELAVDAGNCPVVATGGLSSLVTPLSRTITCTNDNLTLEGLRLIYEMQSAK